MNLTWLGQGGFLLESNGRRLVIDPYLSDSLAKSHGTFRMIPPPMAIDETVPDVVFVTHDHLDHFDPETMGPLFKTFPKCRLVGPESVVEHGRREGFCRRADVVYRSWTNDRSGRLSAHRHAGAS